MANAAQAETRGFTAEVGKVLDLVIHSLYSNKEIFLRELISNASDANDKLRFAAITNNALYGDDAELKVWVGFDKEARTITVRDNGIGMSRDETIEHLGTIAKSGTSEFLSQLTGDESKDSQLIGQFGVGFYSSFIVADRVTVRTRRADAKAADAVQWESAGEGQYDVKTITKDQRGTEVTLHLRKDADEFSDNMRLKSIITKYADHISWPVIMQEMVTIEEDAKEGEEGEEKSAPKQELQDITVNRATALWTLSKNEIKDEEYIELYKHISHDFQDPMLWSHNHVEGKQHYISLLYIPAHTPFDLYNPEYKQGLKLYVQRVFIMDDAEQFLPKYLRFVKGIVDSSDLPLNVSRELLQDNRVINTIRAANVKKILGMLEKLAKDDAEKYQTFWDAFGQVMKEGPIEDFAHRDQVAKLLRFSSTHTDDTAQTVSLQDYVGRMKEDQAKIYYVTAESFNAAKNSPHLEIFRQKGIEVLLLTDKIDEWLVSHLSEFDGKQLQSITKGELDLGEMEDEETKKEHEESDKAFSSLIEHAQKVLGDKVKEVRITHRLTDSPACVVADQYDMGRQMQRIMEAAGQTMPVSKPIFELNPEHRIVQRLQAETDDERFGEWVHILLDQAILAEGGTLEDANAFVKRLNKMLLALTA